VAFKAILFSLIFLLPGFAQDTTKSLAFKKNKQYRNSPFFYQPDLSYQLLQQFKLIQEANAGDPRAQHELGMRMLLGEGMVPDTVQAVYWVRKAASQGMISAIYNYGVLLINGWGVEWNPFEAYKNFYKAAQNGMAQAQYIIGILQTDNLVVPKDLNRAYIWTKKAYENGFEPAKEVVDALSEYVDEQNISIDDSLNNDIFNYEDIHNEGSFESSIGLVFLDFDAINDTIKVITDRMLIKDLANCGINYILDSLNISLDSNLGDLEDNKQLSKLKELAEAGSPEALTILGRLYETGNSFNQNLILAAEYYIRAIRLDSPKSPVLLWNLLQKDNFYSALKSASDKADPIAQFVWYGLHILSYDYRITEFDALNFLEMSANNNHIPAIIELGLNHYSGRFVTESKISGISIWQIGENLGSLEASVRIASAKVFDQFGLFNPEKLVNFLVEASTKGSILSEVALASAYENGIGVKRNVATAVKHYRNASLRGSQFAYKQLQRIHDSLRPAEKEFVIN
jgi:TPR repeat protein